MTLVFAGHRPTRNFANGLFVIGDSAITSDGQTLLSGFRKVYPLSIKLWKPTFTGGQYRGYSGVHSEWQGFVAFAGSTLSSQHYLNSVVEHLSNLRISCERTGPFKLKVDWLCSQNNPVLDGNSYWDDNLFDSRKYKGLVSEELIVETIQHSLEAAAKSARKYKLDEEAFNTLLNEFAFGFQDPANHDKFCLYHFKINPITVEFVRQVEVVKKKVQEDELIVLGMEQEFGAEARAAYAKGLSSEVGVEQALWDFSIDAIKKVKGSGRSGIDEPVYHWHFEAYAPYLRLRNRSRSSLVEEVDESQVP
ncbi:hypothetical protein [Variovorax sp. tm]|uniref:hypothetical protein n=1 Tax=Variovorax atrisoli TaxID=3394203 RepID=UPI003A7F9847